MQLVKQSLYCAVVCLTMCRVACGDTNVPGTGRTFFVSASSGDDHNDGLSPQLPWRSLDKVNAAELRPGDKALFKCGDTWRGQLVPQSGKEGEPVTYGAYGDGDKPLLLGSVSRSESRDWRHQDGNIWSTAKPIFAELEPLNDFVAQPWSVYTEDGAKVKTTKVPAEAQGPLPVTQIECAHSGTKGNHIQLYNGNVAVHEGDYFEFAFRVRCTKPFTIRSGSLSKQTTPWTSYGGFSVREIAVDPEWTACTARFEATQTANDGRITIYLGGVLPAGATFYFQPVSWKRLQCNEAESLSLDVGNIIFDHGKSVGVKKWKQDDLKYQGDYWYSGETWQVYIYSEKNPADLHRSIELALCRLNVDQGGKSYVVYDNLAVRYGAAHGFGGDSTRNIIIRNCDISWIGGGHQLTRPDGKPVRYGNGVEFWENASDNLVEGCRIWEVYDAALTNQGGRGNQQVNITYRDNVIWNCEYSFEYWNRGQESKTRNIRFEHNTCVNAGFGWGHTQRPDPNGRHLMFYDNSAQTSDFYVRHNIFSNATDSGMRMGNDWTAGLVMNRNCWFQPRGVLILFIERPFAPGQFAEYQKQSGLDAHSIVADPKLVDIGKLDFRLADGSPARRLSTEGGPVGALKRLLE